MRRLLFLYTTLLLGLWALSLVRGGEPAPLIALRDGGLLLMVAGVIFGLLSRSRPQPVPAQAVTWPRMARILALAGGLAGAAGSGVVAALLLGWLPGDLLPVGLLLWLGGSGLLIPAALWPAARSRPAAQGWNVDAARAYLVQASQRQESQEAIPTRGVVLWLGMGLILALAGAVRLWLGGEPVGCSGEGCTQALTALDLLRQRDGLGLLAHDVPLYLGLVALTFGIFSPDLSTLSGLGILLGSVSVPLLYLAASRVVQPATALIAALLLALSPWHIHLSRAPEPILLLIPLLFALIWLMGWAGGGGRGPGWLLPGLLAGALVMAAPAWSLPWLLLWLVMAPGLRPWPHLLLYWTGLVIAAAPGLAAFWMQPAAYGWSGASGLADLAAALLVASGPAEAGIALLGLLGLAALLRQVRSPLGQSLAAALLIYLPFALFTDLLPPASGISLLLAWLTLTAAFALEQLVGDFARLWRPVLRPVTVYAGAAGIALLLVGGLAWPDLNRADASLGDGEIPPAAVQQAVGRYLAEHFATSVDNGGENNALVLVPAEVLDAPATQLAAGGVLAYANRIRALSPVEHLPFVGSPFLDLPVDGDLIYVIPAAQGDLFTWSRALYPDAPSRALTLHAPEEGETVGMAQPVLAYALTVSRQDVAARQGLRLSFHEGGDLAAPALFTAPQTEALSLDWQDEPPLLPSFGVQGEGFLFVPESGLFGFEVDVESGAQVTITIGPGDVAGERFVLSEAQPRQERELIRGLLPVRVEYVSGASAPRLALLWQRPEGKLEPVPSQALYTLPGYQGLLASYYGPGPAWADRPLLTRQRDPVPGSVPSSLSGEGAWVVWEGQLATPIQGAYEFRVGEWGEYELAIDGITLIETERADPERRQATIQLMRGWHSVRLAYRPHPAGDGFQWLWQPPGTFRTPVPAGLLRPFSPGADMSLAALPDMPSMARPPVALMPERAVPPLTGPGQFRVLSDDRPAGLFELPAELVWRSGGCGIGPDALSAPRGVVILQEQNRVVVADGGSPGLVVYQIGDGRFEQRFSRDFFEEPFDLGRNILGDLFLLDAVAQQVYQVDLNQDRADALPLGTSFYRPRGMGVDVGGNLLVADTGGARVVMLSPGGQVMAQFGGADTLLGQGQPVDAIALPNGALWAITAEDGRLWRLDQGVGWAVVPPTNTFDAPHLAGLTNSAFFLTDPEGRRVIYLDVLGQPLGFFGQDAFAKPVGIDAALGPAGVLVAVTDSPACAVSLWRIPLDALP